MDHKCPESDVVLNAFPGFKLPLFGLSTWPVHFFVLQVLCFMACRGIIFHIKTPKKIPRH